MILLMSSSLLGEIGKLPDLLNRNHAAFDPSRPELKRRNVLRNLRENLCERDRIGLRVSDRIGALQIFEQPSVGVPAAARSATVFFTT